MHQSRDETARIRMRLNNATGTPTPEASRIFPCYETTMQGSQLNTHLASQHAVYCLINYPTEGIIKLEFEAVIKEAYSKY